MQRLQRREYGTKITKSMVASQYAARCLATVTDEALVQALYMFVCICLYMYVCFFCKAARNK